VPVKLTPRLTKAARALAGLDVDALAGEAGVDRSDLARFESGPETATMGKLDALAMALERAGVSLVVEDDIAVGVRLRAPGDAATLPVDELNASNDK
jgi:transcriptional regulator with XRE-family HTH domain